MAFKRNFLHFVQQAFRRQLLRPKREDAYVEINPSYRRRHFRHELSPFVLATVSLEGKAFTMTNLSYGGLQLSGSGLDLESLEACYQSGTVLEIQLEIFGFKHSLAARVVEWELNQANLSFEYLNRADEQFLSKFLYFMDAGSTLKALSKGRVNDMYQNPYWQSYGGIDQTAEVHIKQDAQGEIAEAHVFYINGFRQDLATFSPKAVAAFCRPKAELSLQERRLILIHVTCILLGLRQVGKTERLDGLIKRSLEKLSLPIEES